MLLQSRAQTAYGPYLLLEEAYRHFRALAAKPDKSLYRSRIFLIFTISLIKIFVCLGCQGDMAG